MIRARNRINLSINGSSQRRNVNELKEMSNSNNNNQSLFSRFGQTNRRIGDGIKEYQNQERGGQSIMTGNQINYRAQREDVRHNKEEEAIGKERNKQMKNANIVKAVGNVLNPLSNIGNLLPRSKTTTKFGKRGGKQGTIKEVSKINDPS